VAAHARRSDGGSRAAERSLRRVRGRSRAAIAGKGHTRARPRAARLTMKVATHSAITAWRKDTELSSVEKVSGIVADDEGGERRDGVGLTDVRWQCPGGAGESRSAARK
jgi:hypothetical protein